MSYWSQFDRYELDAMQGKNFEDFDLEELNLEDFENLADKKVSHEDEDEDKENTDYPTDCRCSNGCHNCLGMSWRDFM